MRAVLDTNVVVSGALTAHGACGQILDLLAEGVFDLPANDSILAEYERVLHRPSVGIEPRDAQEILELVLSAAQPVSALPLPVVLPHEADRPFLEVAAAADAVLVTGNLRHFPGQARGGVTVVGPEEFLELLRRVS